MTRPLKAVTGGHIDPWNGKKIAVFHWLSCSFLDCHMSIWSDLRDSKTTLFLPIL